MMTTLVGALMTGLLGTPHCAAMCGAFATSCATQERPFGRTAAYHAGRLTSYASLGAVAGTLGATLQHARVVGLVLAALFLFYFAARVAGLLPEVGVNLPGVGRAIKAARRMSGPSGGFVLGASTALLPCGLVYAALALPIVAASPLQGAGTMAMMWVGTLPALLAVALLGRRIPRANRAARYALAAALLVSGLYGLWYRAPFSADEGQSSCCAHEG